MESDLIIKEHKIGIRIDNKNNLLYTFGLDINNNIDESSKGILNYVNTEIAKKIEGSLGIYLQQYNVAITDCVTSFSMPKIKK